MDTSRSFSHAVSEHRHKASGFKEEDIIYETFQNSLDARADKIIYQFIENNNKYYFEGYFIYRCLHLHLYFY